MKKLGFVDPYKSKCLVCGLNKKCANGQFEAVGEGKAGVLVVLECPTNAETTSGQHLLGTSYDFISASLRNIGLSLEKDCVRVHAVRCRKPFKKGQADYTETEIVSCYPYLLGKIEKMKPKAILTFGSTALKGILSKEFSDTSIGRWHGLPLQYTTEKGHRCWLMPTFSPSVDKESKGGDIYKPVITKEVKEFGKLLKKPLPPEKRPNVVHLMNAKEICKALEETKNAKFLSIDYETTGKKPDHPDHRIVTVSVTAVYKGPSEDPYDDDDAETISFPLSYKGVFNEDEQADIAEALVEAMDNESLIIAHNHKFEQRWTSTILGYDFPKKRSYCTMIIAHLMDERKKFCSLKFQAYLHFGLPDYSKGMQKYIESEDQGGNAFNKIDDAPLPELLEYNGYDTYYTYLLFKIQRKYWKETKHLSKGVGHLFLRGSVALGNAEGEGFDTVDNYFEKNSKKIRKEIEDLKSDMLKMRESILFKKKTGRNFEFGKDKDLDIMLYDIIGVDLEKNTESGKRAKDAEVMLSMKHPWTAKFLDVAKREKVESTYFGQIVREALDNKLHTNYNLHTTRTGRSSSMSPNWQNLPKRDPMAKKYVRNGICAPKGHCLFEADYGSLEVRIAACYTKDPKLIGYILDPKTDMHRDSALDIFHMKHSEYNSLDKKKAGMIRFHAKNGFVFANFYGSSFKSCAKTLWKIAPDLAVDEKTTMLDHLNYQGFRSYNDYEDHIKSIVDKFWKKFKVFRKWQQENMEFYKKNLYIENYLGFRRHGPLTRNEIGNTAIQGTAFMCLLWALDRIDDIQNEENWNSRIRGQIHDSIVGSLDPEEQDIVFPTIKRVMEVELLEHFPWINVPMVAEFEVSPVNGTWNDLEGVEV
jgi:uracil-DNA glycosylase family 4